MQSEVIPVNLRHIEGTDNRKLDMVVVVPVARSDWHLAMKLLAWMDCLKDSPELIVYCAPGVTENERYQLAKQTNCTVVHASFNDPGYFGGANLLFKGALDYVEANHPGKAMLWVEADAVPMRSGWFADILDEYRGCGQPFMGDVHLGGLHHMTGNGCWTPDWRKIAPSLVALPGPDPEWGWDSQAAQDTLTRCHRARTIQQIWRPSLPITAAWAAENIRASTALFHQSKDGSLIDVLCRQQGHPIIPDLPQLEKSTYEKGRQTPEDPELVRHLSPQQRITVGLPTNSTAGMGVMIVGCLKDMDFLRYALKSIDKNASGFTEVVVAVQDDEAHHFKWIKKQRLHVYTPADRTKPMLSHEVIKCRADEIMPSSEAILYMDSDCFFWQKATPENYVVNGKLKLVRERYADLRNPLRKNWQKCVEDSLGFKPEYEGMVCHGISHWRETLKATRLAVEAHTGMKFDDHVVSGRDKFQQEFAEFDSLAAIAIRDFRHRYHCIDYSWPRDAMECGLPEAQPGQYIYRKGRDVMVETWSHGGIQQYKSEFEAWLVGRVPEFFIK